MEEHTIIIKVKACKGRVVEFAEDIKADAHFTFGDFCSELTVDNEPVELKF